MPISAKWINGGKPSIRKKKKRGIKTTNGDYWVGEIFFYFLIKSKNCGPERYNFAVIYKFLKLSVLVQFVSKDLYHKFLFEVY